MQHLRKPCEGVPASAKLAPPFPISISQITHQPLSLPLSGVPTLLLFSFLPLSLLIPGPYPGSYVLSSHVFWGSSGHRGWYLRYLMLSHHLSEMIFRGDSSSEAPHFPHEAIASPATSHWQTHLGGSEDMSACSPIWGPPATRLSYTIWQRVPCAVSIQEEGSYETPQTEITLLRRNTLTAVRMHTDSVQP